MSSSDLPHPGLRARNLRKRLGLTIDQVSELTELSKGHLSRFERGEKTLSVAALLRLASALHSNVSILLGEELGRDEIHLMRKGDAPVVDGREGDCGHQFRALSSGDSAANHNSFQLILAEDQIHRATVFHSGRELLYVLSGRVSIDVGGRVMALDEGDYLEFPGNIPHSLRGVSGPATILMIVVK